jgi:hypothetical protein
MAVFAGNYTMKVIHYIVQPGPGGEFWAIDSSAPQAAINTNVDPPVVELQNQFPAFTASNVYLSYAEAAAAAMALLEKVKASTIELIEIDLTGG